MARELYYLVESVSTATPGNKNFDGEVHTHIYGKSDYTLFRETPDGWCNCNLLAPHWIREYGYKRECDARRNWCYKHPQNDEHWKTETRIITAWVRKDGKVLLTP